MTIFDEAQMMKRFTILMLLLVSTNVFADNDTYLCIAEKSTGFNFSEQTKAWESLDFNVTDIKYILKNNNNTWEWKAFGSKDSLPTTCSYFNKYGIMNCTGMYEVSFSRENLRFQQFFKLGYVDNFKSNPNIVIGRCSPI